MERVTVEQMYGDWSIADSAIQDALDRSLNPRSSSSLFEVVGSLGIDSGVEVLDIGARDARYSVTLHELLGCGRSCTTPR